MDLNYAPDVVFPHLGLVVRHLPRSFDVFGFPVYFYGATMALGMLGGLLVAQALMRRDGEKADLMFDFALWGVVFGLLGARAYYVIFSWDSYKNNLLNIFNLREGGLAVFGAVLGGALAMLVFTRRRKLSFFYLADYAVCGLLVGQIVGRWGNFFNAEAFGGYTDGLPAMQIRRAVVSPGMISPSLEAAMTAHPVLYAGEAYVQVHPTFFYEGLWNFALLLALLFWRRRKVFTGEIMFAYFAGEGLGRFWIEGLRTDQLLIPFVQAPVSQVLSVVFFGLGVFGLLRGRRKERARERFDSAG
ncbi:MAG: prolipoprotein diacylglyceryl transferase [Gracilibacteraceae bacterium]|jgi:phosphatidylglycerol:prolipoprotein diacylglycerol transferase|nr:prolipoprotein diacylglyceryl transferase [Gracilibacteraceae bacterium]